MADGACDEQRIYEEDAALAEMRTEEARMEQLRHESERVKAILLAAKEVAEQIEEALTDISEASAEMLKQVGREETHTAFPIEVLVAWRALLLGPGFPTEQDWMAMQGKLQRARHERVPIVSPWAKPMVNALRGGDPAILTKGDLATPPKVVECRLCRAWHRAPPCELPAAAR